MLWECECGCRGIAADLPRCPMCGKERDMPKATSGGASNAWEQPDGDVFEMSAEWEPEGVPVSEEPAAEASAEPAVEEPAAADPVAAEEPPAAAPEDPAEEPATVEDGAAPKAASVPRKA